jgi:hypothetical protein
MSPLSASDVFLTVAIMSATFLTEVGLFHLDRDDLKESRALSSRAADANV